MRVIILSLKVLLIAFLAFIPDAQARKVNTPAPCGPVPTENQLRWQDMEMYAFIHYSMNTYTDQEWGYGNEDLSLFNPSDLDCRQWARVCKQAGMKGIIFTAKHHCGFCMCIDMVEEAEDFTVLLQEVDHRLIQPGQLLELLILPRIMH